MLKNTRCGERKKMRDIRKKGWFWVENELIDRTDLSFEVKSMYMILARFADAEGKCFPSVEKLAEIIGKDKRTVIRYMKKLEEKGLIEKKRRFNQTNIYYLKNVALNSDKIDNDKNDSDIVVTSLDDTGVTSDSDKNVNLKKHNEKNTIKNTQYNIKEKSKKEKTKSKIEDFVNKLEKSDEYKALILEYIKYRKEIKKTIKTIAPINKLLKDFPDSKRLSEAIEIAKEREWTGLEPEWIENYKNTKTGGNNNAKDFRDNKAKSKRSQIRERKPNYDIEF